MNKSWLYQIHPPAAFQGGLGWLTRTVRGVSSSVMLNIATSDLGATETSMVFKSILRLDISCIKCRCRSDGERGRKNSYSQSVVCQLVTAMESSTAYTELQVEKCKPGTHHGNRTRKGIDGLERVFVLTQKT